jgi:hypothetical protein
MGYKRERRVYRLVFDDPEFEGLEVRARSIPIRDLKRLMALDTESDSKGDRAAAITEMMFSFAEALVSWNMEDDNGPVPPTLESIEAEDADFMMMIIGQWLSVISRVDDASPLPATSGSGSQSLEVSIPMEPLSRSQAS